MHAEPSSKVLGEELRELPDSKFKARWDGLDDETKRRYLTPTEKVEFKGRRRRMDDARDNQAAALFAAKIVKSNGGADTSGVPTREEKAADQAMQSIESAGNAAPPNKPPLQAPLWPEPLDLEALAEREPEAPKFVVPDFLPCGYATLFAGHGGVGKSGIALFLAVCIASGSAFFGLSVERRRVMYLSCEDREGILHWRLWRICKFLGINVSSLRGWLDAFDLVGRESVLWERDPKTGYALTPAYGELLTRTAKHETQVLFVDGVSDSFGGNENSRGEVKRFVNALLAFVPQDEGALVLIGHISKPTASGVTTTEGYSGSTGWHNAVRARWYLYPETRQGEEASRTERTGDLIMELQKSNLGPMNQALRFAWDEEHHLFVGRTISPATNRDREARDEVDIRGILGALRGCEGTDPPIIVPAATTGQRTAYSVLSQRPEFPDGLKANTKPNRSRFWRLLERLRQQQHVGESGFKRPDGHKGTRLVPYGESGNA